MQTIFDEKGLSSTAKAQWVAGAQGGMPQSGNDQKTASNQPLVK